MPWTTDDYPQSWKNLDEEVRDKAIEVGNALLADGMEESRAIPIALSQARESVGEAEKQDQWVLPHDEGWAVKTEGKQPRKVFERKSDAVMAAVDFAREHGVALTIQGRDGQIQDRQSFRSRVS